MINILLIGSGGREHAIVKALFRTSHTQISLTYLSTTENPALSRLTAPNSAIIIKEFTLNNIRPLLPHFISLCLSYVIIGPEAPLEQSFTDFFEEHNIPVVGPTKENAQIETSKYYCRNLLSCNAILSEHQPKYRYFDSPTPENLETAIGYIVTELNGEYVIKQDGLCGGKGVVVSGDHLFNTSSAISHIDSLTTPYIIEEKLIGEEFSLITLTDGVNHIHFPPVQDFKRLNNNNLGPNTGSMGAYTLADHTLPFLTSKDIIECNVINEITLGELNDHHDKRYKGFLYGSFMKTETGIKIIEYNARLGDPESINLMELINTDLHLLFQRTVDRQLDYYDYTDNEIFRPIATVTKYLVPWRYPRKSIRNFRVTLPESVPQLALIYASLQQKTNHHGETYYEGCNSRTLAIVTNAPTIKAAADKAELYASRIKGNKGKIDDLHYRTDIGYLFSTLSQSSPVTTPPEPSQSAYEASGVSIDEGNRVVAAIRESIESTYTPRTVPNFGDFGGLFEVCEDRILVASTDGVGTKTEHLRNILNDNQPLLYRTLGQDIVNHCVNDILVKNAFPLFFLDYYASSKLNHKNVQYLVEGIAKACRETGTALLGGETAEMPSVYTTEAFDIAGTIVGETTPKTIINGKLSITKDTVIYYLPSSGPHTNGYSLIRSIYESAPKHITPELNAFTSQPHRCYLQDIKTLQAASITIQALCHVTGGGLIDNPERVAPSYLTTNLDTGKILRTMPKEFKLLQSLGKITDKEMLRVFNCGVGMLIYLSPEMAKLATAILPELTFIGSMS